MVLFRVSNVCVLSEPVFLSDVSGVSHYISVIVHQFTKTIYILHSQQSHNANVKEHVLKRLINVNQYDVREIVFRLKEDTRISICYAYVRAKLALRSSISVSSLPDMREDIDILKEKNLYKMASLVFMIHNKDDPQVRKRFFHPLLSVCFYS